MLAIHSWRGAAGRCCQAVSLPGALSGAPALPCLAESTDALDSVGGRFAAGGTVATPDLSKYWTSQGQDVAPDAADGMESLADAGAEAEVEVLEKMSDSMDRQVELLKKIAENPKGGGMILWQ